jgi:peroxiredoxin
MAPYAGWTAEADLLRKLNFIPEPSFAPAPDFSTVDIAGRPVGRDSYLGKVVVLNFWATWCPPCRLEMPSMEKLYREFEDQGLEIVAVNFMESPELVKEFVLEEGLTYPILIDRQASIAESYGVMRLPETVLIGRRGNLLGKSAGYKDWYKQDVRDLVSLLLKDEEAVMKSARQAPARPGSGRAVRDPYLMLAFGLALVFLLAYYVRKARTKKTDPAVPGA